MYIQLIQHFLCNHMIMSCSYLFSLHPKHSLSKNTDKKSSTSDDQYSQALETGEAFINPEQMMRKHGNACSRAHPPDVLKPVSLVSSAFCNKRKKKRVLGFYTAHVAFYKNSF